MPSLATAVIPIKYECLGKLRRSQLEEPPQLTQLHQQLARALPEHAWIFATFRFRLVYEHDGQR